MKRALKTTAFWLLRFTGIAALVRHTVQRQRLTVLAYHDPAPDDFASHLDLLQSRYSIVALQDVLDAFDAGDFGGLPVRPLLLTADDGWAGNHDLIGPIESHGVRPAVFVCTSVVGSGRHFWWTHVTDGVELEALKRVPEADRVERLRALGFDSGSEYAERQALSAEEVRALADVADVESHTRVHPILPACPDEYAREEIVRSATELEKLVGERPQAFAYPNGDHTQRDAGLVREAGYDCAFTLEPGYNLPITDCYRIKRILIKDDAGPTELIACASGTYPLLVRYLRRIVGFEDPAPRGTAR